MSQAKNDIHLLIVEETVTLMSVHMSLQDWLKKIEVVYSLYNKGIMEAEVLHTNCQKASHLLNVLYNTVIEYDDSGQSGTQIVSVLYIKHRNYKSCRRRRTFL